MANYTLKLSDGTTTIDFYGTNYKILEGGLDLTPPSKTISRLSSEYTDGDSIQSVKYRNRTVTIKLRIIGTTLADLKAQIRALEAVLNDAQARYIAGYGTKYYLEYQWGTAAGESVYFDVLQGELKLPDEFYSRVMYDSKSVIACTLSLECLPFARYTNADIAAETLENMDAGAAHNYQTITAATIASDAPAPAYIKITPTDTTGEKYTYIAKRSGSRYADDLWTEGEDETSVTDLMAGVGVQADSDEVDATCSGGDFKRINNGVYYYSHPVAGTLLSRLNFDITTIPKGLFRLLARCRVNQEYARLAFGAGYSTGNLSDTPTDAGGDFLYCTADATWRLMDFGLFKIPPFYDSDIAGDPTYTLRLFQGVHTAPTAAAVNAVWTTSENAVDANTGTAATINFGAGGGASGYLTITVDNMDITRVRYYINDSPHNLTNLEIDVYDGSVWTNILNAMPTLGVYTTVTFASQAVEQIRARVVASDATQVSMYELEPIIDYNFDIDYYFLMPADEGYCIVNSAATDVIALDCITHNPEVYLVDGTGKQLEVAETIGAPFTLGRENTRIYVLRDDVPAATFSIDTKYQSRRLLI